MSGVDGALNITDAQPAAGAAAPEVKVAGAAAKGLCPRCGSATLFRGIATFNRDCAACGLDYSAFNVGDGPAAFLTLIVGALITALAIGLELAFKPSFAVHLIWFPITLAAVMGSLRVTKGLLLILEYRNAAREGRIQD